MSKPWKQCLHKFIKLYINPIICFFIGHKWKKRLYIKTLDSGIPVYRQYCIRCSAAENRRDYTTTIVVDIKK